jgi:hypothetical protein
LSVYDNSNKMKIGILGFKNSGKSEIGRYLQEKHGLINVSFAGTLKDSIAPIFGWPRDLLEGDTPESRLFRETPDPFWSEKLRCAFTPRWALQNIGTDVFRTHFNDKIWIYSFEKKIEGLENFVVTDVRFPDEIEFLKSKGVTLVYVERGIPPGWFYDIKNVPSDIHCSEYAWIQHIPKLCIKNNGTKKDLYDEIEKFLLTIDPHQLFH